MAVIRKSSGQFAAGWSGGPGRPPGARSKLSETALQMLGEHFAEFGKTAIDTVYREKPAIYLQIIASLLPRQMTVERTSMLGELSDEEIAQLMEHLNGLRARLVQQIEPEK